MCTNPLVRWRLVFCREFQQKQPVRTALRVTTLQRPTPHSAEPCNNRHSAQIHPGPRAAKAPEQPLPGGTAFLLRRDIYTDACPCVQMLLCRVLLGDIHVRSCPYCAMHGLCELLRYAWFTQVVRRSANTTTKTNTVAPKPATTTCGGRRKSPTQPTCTTASWGKRPHVRVFAQVKL